VFSIVGSTGVSRPGETTVSFPPRRVPRTISRPEHDDAAYPPSRHAAFRAWFQGGIEFGEPLDHAFFDLVAYLAELVQLVFLSALERRRILES
jgi:hypothetical protein